MTKPPIRRRIGTSIAALTLIVGLASGCTSGDWRYESPSAAGVQQDAGTVKLRNIMLLADGEGEGLLLGSVFTSEPINLTQVAVAAQLEDGTFGQPVAVGVGGEVPLKGGIPMGDDDSRVEGAELQEGLLATVVMVFSDGTTMTIAAPVMASTHPDYASAWDTVMG